MIPLYNENEFQSATFTQKFKCQCHYCDQPFFTTKREISYALKGTRDSAKFCSKECNRQSQVKKCIVKCTKCDIDFEKIPAEIKNKNFCSRSCAATYNNKNKTTGTRRSKLEIWLENQLPPLYPDIEFHFNKKDAIDSELDIYLPALSLAFELNGIFHYEPIYGDKKLNQIQENDQNKFQNCITRGISLCIIDVSQFKHFKPDRAQKYLKIINDIIKERLLTS